MLTRYEAVAKRKELEKELQTLREKYAACGIIIDQINKAKKALKKQDPTEQMNPESLKKLEEAKDYRKKFRSDILSVQGQIDKLDLDFKYSIGPLTMYEEDNMYMSYRYCIGRLSIGSQYHAGEIAKYCYGRMTDERSVFTAFDINREIERHLGFRSAGPSFYFPITSLNRIYKTAIDIWCEFIQEHNIKTKEELLKYESVHVELDPPYSRDTDKYSLKITTWEDYANQHGLDINNIPSDEELDKMDKTTAENYRYLSRRPKPDNFYLSEVDALFVWNDLCHLFDLEHHETVRIEHDGKEEIVETFWTWCESYERDEEGNRVEVAYQKIRVPVNEWNGHVTTWIPEEYVKEIISTGKDVW